MIMTELTPAEVATLASLRAGTHCVVSVAGKARLDALDHINGLIKREIERGVHGTSVLAAAPEGDDDGR